MIIAGIILLIAGGGAWLTMDVAISRNHHLIPESLLFQIGYLACFATGVIGATLLVVCVIGYLI